jgi:drug/metabolite transporter (DMT)-like permease
LTPIATATFRFLIVGSLFVVMALSNKEKFTASRLPSCRDLGMLLFLSLTGVTFYFIAQYQGIQMAGASIASIMVCLLSPVLITILSTIVLKERLTQRQIFGIGSASLGTFIVITGGSVYFQSNPRFFLGSPILLLTPILWATYGIAGKKMMRKYDPFLILVYVNALGALCLIPFSLIEGSFLQILKMTFTGWLAILYLAITCSLFGYYIWFHAMKRLGATVTSSFLFAEPLVTVILATTFLRENLSFSTILGGFLIFAGVYAVVKK